MGAMPFADESYDAVTAFEAVRFWPNLHRNFSEIRRVRKPGANC